MKFRILLISAFFSGVAVGLMFSYRKFNPPPSIVLDMAGVCFSVTDRTEIEYLSKFDISLSDVVDKYKAVIILQAFYEEVRSIRFGGISCIGKVNMYSSIINDANQRVLLPARAVGVQLARDTMLLLRLSGDEKHSLAWCREKFSLCAMHVEYDMDPLTPKIFRAGSIAYEEHELVLNQPDWHEYIGVKVSMQALRGEGGSPESSAIEGKRGLP